MESIDIRSLERLRNLHLNIKRSFSVNEGKRRTSRKGRSAEFSGYREYIPGDDMRYVDWNAYARLDKMYIKEYMEEREGRVNILLDTSKSMDFGEHLKSTLMSELTLALSYIASNGKDAVYVTDLGNVSNTFRVPSGNNGLLMLKKWLENVQVKGSVNISDSIKRINIGRGGSVFILSDFMDENFADRERDIIKYLQYKNMEVSFVHILSEEEVNIDLTGAYDFYDSENEGANVRVTLDTQTISQYEKALDNYIKKIKTNALSSGATYYLCTTKDTFDKVIFETMRTIFI